MAYTVSKLTDYSAAVLERAASQLLAALKEEADQAWQTEAAWRAFRDRWLARKSGLLTQVNDVWLKAAPKDAKREVGRRVNEIKLEVEHTIQNIANQLLEWAATAPVAGSPKSVDITLPGVRRPIGAEHPVVKTTNE